MIYHLLYGLKDQISAFNVFRYLTFRMALAALTALLLSLALGPYVIRRLRQLQVGQVAREEGPAHHAVKTGTPTMGGLLIIVAVIIPTLLWADLTNLFVWVATGTTLVFGAIGFADDYIKVVRRRNLGLTARVKFIWQSVAALVLGGVLVTMARHGLFSTELSFPFFKQLHPDLGWGFLGLAVLVVVGTANAVNFTDGLDGLAIGSVGIACGTFAVLCYAAGNIRIANYLAIPYIRGAGELAVLCGALVGASLGFLWYNCNPAEVFMGDVGSMALGGTIGTMALLTKQEFVLILVGGLFVAEALSVILQVSSYRLRGRRLFRMAPIHHHFELAGWPEPKVIIRFWIVAIIFALLSLSTLKLR
ncbi:MAG: phospho-N-acetylmuramoyl-pentapeptide-transferase [Acidobacteriota bacterium]